MKLEAKLATEANKFKSLIDSEASTMLEDDILLTFEIG